MCGILSVINYPVENKKLISSLKLMDHRGPDNQSFFANEKLFMGHNRLAIIDLDARSNQPFRDGGMVIVYNGEVYNYKELITDHH